MILFHLFRTPALSAYQTADLLAAAQQKVYPAITGIKTEFCFNIAATEPLSADEMRLLRWLLAETFEPEKFSDKTFLYSELRTPNSELHPRGRSPHELHHCLVHERGLGLPRLRPRKDHEDRALPTIPPRSCPKMPQ